MIEITVFVFPLTLCSVFMV